MKTSEDVNECWTECLKRMKTEDKIYHYWNQCQHNPHDDHHIDRSFKDWELISEIKSETNLIRLMTASLCPQIYGHEMVKTALLLSLFSGTHKYDKECDEIRIRAQIHVLIIGNHGSGKDLLLKSVESMAPKCEYVCGITSTIQGLVANVVHKGGKNVIKKGQLVSADLGICCIDEFDQMKAQQHQALVQVMEHQTVSVIERGLVHKLSARTAIIAAANPVSGAYDMSKNVWENIKVNESVVSKFDLMFALLDSPDQELDSKLSKNILFSRRLNVSNSQNSESVKSLNSSDTSSYSQSFKSGRTDCNLMCKLIFGPEEEEPDLIPHSLLRKYISYAHKYIQPVISDEARALLNQFCHKIAKTKVSKSKTRNLEILYRLTESRAKLELRSIASKEDALDVIDIVEHSLDKYVMVSTICPTNHLMSGSSKKAKALNLIKALQIIAQQNECNTFSVKEITEICSKFNIPFDGKEDILTTIERLNNETLLLKNGSNYRLNV